MDGGKMGWQLSLLDVGTAVLTPAPVLVKPAEKSRSRLRLPMVAQPDLFNDGDLAGYRRPQTRGECEGGERPCPYVSCRHHLLLEATEHGTLIPNFPEALEVWVYEGPLLEDGRFFTTGEGRVVDGPHLDMLPATCALDVADMVAAMTYSREPTNDEIGAYIGLSRERVRQIVAIVEDEVQEGLDRGDEDLVILAELAGVEDY